MNGPDRVTVVLGAARGIGAATARACAARGDAVVLADRGADDPRVPYALATSADLDAAVASARAAAGDPSLITGVAVDATDESAVGVVLEDAAARHGGLDAVVVTAGVVAGGVPLWEMPAAELRAVLDVDLGAAVAAARAGIPIMLRRPAPRAGRFVVVASTAASRGLPMLAAYCAAKAGVVGLVRALAAELRGTGVTANAVSPGSTDTPILAESARLYSLPAAETFAAQQPIERLIQPAEVAAVLAWLAGPDSGAVTGADHVIDGGLSV
ncbi:MAG TPA: mycofactocin-coupled SDR family oxidoreductase [Baekduia sp.]|nr:mycofactocin-coupled SDR family oxidoreductase [Baekduia sp.]